MIENVMADEDRSNLDRDENNDESINYTTKVESKRRISSIKS
jgi:hypothetical protein